MENLSIDFYDPRHAAVKVILPEELLEAEDPSARPFIELLLFASFTLRQLKRLAVPPAAGTALADHLLRASTSPGVTILVPDTPTAPLITTAPSHIFWDASIPQREGPARPREPIFLVPHNGPGLRQFLARLRFHEHRPSLSLEATGFTYPGSLDPEFPMFAADSVAHLWAHFWSVFSIDNRLLDVFAGITRDCARAHHEGLTSTTMFPLERLAHRIVNTHLFPDLVVAPEGRSADPVSEADTGPSIPSGLLTPGPSTTNRNGYNPFDTYATNVFHRLTCLAILSLPILLLASLTAVVALVASAPAFLAQLVARAFNLPFQSWMGEATTAICSIGVLALFVTALVKAFSRSSP